MTELLVKSGFITKVALRRFVKRHDDQHCNVVFSTLNLSRSKLSELYKSSESTIKSSKFNSRLMFEQCCIVYFLK